MNCSIVFTDLDGTLLNDHREVSVEDINMLEYLGEKGVVRVIATGRSWFTFRKVIHKDFPIDYLIFSSGAGIIDFRSGEIISSSNHQKGDVEFITRQLFETETDFMVHFPVPENHKFVFCTSNHESTDFQRRIDLYKEFAIPYKAFHELPEVSAQVIAVFNNDLKRFTKVKEQLKNYKIIRTTSPLDGNSIWMEIFPSGVSKGHAAEWLCNYLGVDVSCSFGIGNDYNDLDLLDTTAHSFVVANAPSDMLRKYRTTSDNNNSGFSNALKNVLEI